MKIKLTHQYSYLIGMIKYSRIKKGIGVTGKKEFIESFCAAAIKAKLTDSTKIITSENRAIFYHSAYKAYFERVLKEQTDIFIHLNEFAANYFAGLFDAVGKVDEKTIYFTKFDDKDEMCLLRLGFRVKKQDKKLFIGPKDQFLKFIKNYRKIEDYLLPGNEIEDRKHMSNRDGR